MKKFRSGYDNIAHFVKRIGLHFKIDDDIESMIKQYSEIINYDLINQ
jgi:hypothetical protein